MIEKSGLYNEIAVMINYMSGKKAYKNKNFARTITLLDNILILEKGLVYRIVFPN